VYVVVATEARQNAPNGDSAQPEGQENSCHWPVESHLRNVALVGHSDAPGLQVFGAGAQDTNPSNSAQTSVGPQSIVTT
jgi:hypothetical protein